MSKPHCMSWGEEGMWCGCLLGSGSVFFCMFFSVSFFSILLELNFSGKKKITRLIEEN